MATSLMYMLSGLGLAWLADLMAIRAIYLMGGVLYLLTALYALGRRTLRRSVIAVPPLAQDIQPPSGTATLEP